MERNPGYYWVKPRISPLVWFVAYWCGDEYWSLPGDERAYYEDDFNEVDEKQIPEKQ